jgi:predicted metal-dependent hydrolase
MSQSEQNRQPAGGHTPAPGEGVALLRGQMVPYRIRISSRARVLHLVIRQESGLEIVAPRGTRRRQIEEALHQKASWILKTMQRVVAIPPIKDGREFDFMGRTVRLCLVTSPARKIPYPKVTAAGDTLLLHIQESDRENQEVLRAALEGWYRQRACEIIPARLITANKVFGFRYGRVTIKEQKSRWGSCSRAGNLNFNWRLLLAPVPVLDYVLTHELAHLKELNHAPAFWRLVAQACPDYKMQRRWLREHGHTLRF